MHIKGTKKIKGVMPLPSVKIELSPGKAFPISDTDYWNQDVQLAHQSGYAVAIGSLTEKLTDVNEEEDRLITCRNNYPRPLSLPGFQMEIGPGKKFSLKEG